MSILLFAFNWGKKHFNKTSRKFLFHFLLSSSIKDVEDSESSLKVVWSHDS